jgi:hypothetical protein
MAMLERFTCEVCGNDFQYGDTADGQSVGYCKTMCGPYCDGFQSGRKDPIAHLLAIGKLFSCPAGVDTADERMALVIHVGQVLIESDVKIAMLQDQVQNLLDTVKACLVAVGGSEDDDELERQVKAAGTKPSDFVRSRYLGGAKWK